MTRAGDATVESTVPVFWKLMSLGVRMAWQAPRTPTTMSSASTILDPTVEVFDEQIEAVEVKSIARGSIDMLISESYQAPLLVLVRHLFENSIFCWWCLCVRSCCTSCTSSSTHYRSRFLLCQWAMPGLLQQVLERRTLWYHLDINLATMATYIICPRWWIPVDLLRVLTCKTLNIATDTSYIYLNAIMAACTHRISRCPGFF